MKRVWASLVLACALGCSANQEPFQRFGERSFDRSLIQLVRDAEQSEKSEMRDRCLEALSVYRATGCTKLRHKFQAPGGMTVSQFEDLAEWVSIMADVPQRQVEDWLVREVIN